jgi:hypothetical protein
LLSEAGGGGGFSPTTLFTLAAHRCGFAVPIKTVVRVTAALFGALTVWLLWRTWRGRSPTRSAADVLAAYLVQAFKFRIWYTAWPLPWLLLDLKDGFRRLRVGLWLSLTGQLSLVIYGQLWGYLLGQDHLWTHLIGVPFVFLVPLAMAVLCSTKPLRNTSVPFV